MRQKRSKAYRKQMAYYHLNFKFREPYQVLFDEEIILAALKSKMNLVAAVERTLQAKIKPMITQCTIRALYEAKNEEAIELAKSFERRRCGHGYIRKPQNKGEEQPEKEQEEENKESEDDGESEAKKQQDVSTATTPSDTKALTAFDCMLSVVSVNNTNKHRYVVATQKDGLRGVLRSVPGVPLLYISRAVMILEPFSRATEAVRKKIESDKLSLGLNLAPSAADSHEHGQASKKRRLASSPNPLSVKKKAGSDKAVKTPVSEEPAKKKRKRKHHHHKSESGAVSDENVDHED